LKSAIEETLMSESGVIQRKEAGLTIVSLKGTPLEMGLQHGTLLKNEISRIHDHVLGYLSQIKRGVWGRTVYPLLQLLVWGYNLFIPTEYREELKGIARGAGLSYSSILLINVLDDLGHKMACSCFTVTGAKTKKNTLIYGRNLDYGVFTDLMPSANTIFYYQPSSGFPFVSVAWPAYAGVVTGMSSKKLALGSLTSFSKEKARIGTPSGLLYRKALQYASSLTDFRKSIMNGRRTINNNLLIASTEESVVLEVSPTRGQLRSQQDDVLTVTNHFQNPFMSELKTFFMAKPPGSTLEDELFTEHYSVARNERLQHLCRKGEIDIDEAIAILRDPKISNAGTVQSLLLIPERLELWVARETTAPVSQGEFIQLKDLFKE
jgi:hypothetical protein